MRLKFVALLSMLFVACAACAASAAELSAAARAEIDALLNHLGGSGCQFNRNGTWYGAMEAKDHLLRKRDYLVDRGLVDSAEQFIELAATKSSMSGENYLVKCHDAQPVTSASWLKAELLALRGRLHHAKPPEK